MQILRDIITNILDPLGIVIGLILAIPVFWAWYQVVWGNRRRYHQYLQAIRTAPGNRPAILIIDLLPGRNIRAAVENYCQQHDNLAAIPRERIFYLQRDGLGVYLKLPAAPAFSGVEHGRQSTSVVPRGV